MSDKDPSLNNKENVVKSGMVGSLKTEGLSVVDATALTASFVETYRKTGKNLDKALGELISTLKASPYSLVDEEKLKRIEETFGNLSKQL